MCTAVRPPAADSAEGPLHSRWPLACSAVKATGLSAEHCVGDSITYTTRLVMDTPALLPCS